MPSKQEEIREGITKTLFKESEEMKLMEDVTDAVLRYLSSMGCVLRVNKDDSFGTVAVESLVDKIK